MNILYLIYNGGEQMRYLSVTEIAKKWDVSERSVRNYCAQGRVNGAFLTGKTWNIPENVEKPERSNKKKEQPITLLDILQEQKASKYSGGIYHKTQIELTYNSNHIEGNRLTHDQTRYIFETNTIGVEKDVLNVDDVIETANHFRCIDMIIDKNDRYGKMYLFWSVFDQSILNLPERKVRKWIYINCRFLQMLQNVKVFWQHRKKCISRNLQSVHMCQP